MPFGCVSVFKVASRTAKRKQFWVSRNTQSCISVPAIGVVVSFSSTKIRPSHWLESIRQEVSAASIFAQSKSVQSVKNLYLPSKQHTSWWFLWNYGQSERICLSSVKPFTSAHSWYSSSLQCLQRRFNKPCLQNTEKKPNGSVEKPINVSGYWLLNPNIDFRKKQWTKWISFEVEKNFSFFCCKERD